MTPPAPNGGTSLMHDPQLRRLLLLLGYMVLIAGLAYAFSLVWPMVSTVLRVLSPFIAALVVAYLFNPVVTFVQERLRLTRVGGVLVVVLFMFLVMAIFVGILVPILAAQIRAAYSGIEYTTKQRVIPFVYETLEFDLEPGTASTESLNASVDEWISAQETDVQPEESELLYGRLRREVNSWIASVTVEPGEDEENGRTRTETTEDDLIQLDGLIAYWRDEAREVAPEQASLARTEPLEQRVDEWIESRRDYMGGNIEQPGWDDFQLRARAWLRDRGIDPDEVMRAVAASDQARMVATEGVGVVGTVFGVVIAGVTILVSSAFFLFFVVLVSFYLLIDFDKIRPVLETMVPAKHEARFFDILGKMDTAVGGFIRGQVFVAFVVGTLTTIGLMVLGLKQYALLIGILAGVGNLVPYLGPIVGATPAVLWVLMTDSYDSTQERLVFLLIVLAMFALIQSFESFVLQPKVVGKSASLHPVIVMAALLLGATFGILGMIIAIPVVCIVRVLLKEFFWDARERDRNERRKLEAEDASKHPKEPNPA